MHEPAEHRLSGVDTVQGSVSGTEQALFELEVATGRMCDRRTFNEPVLRLPIARAALVTVTPGTRY